MKVDDYSLGKISNELENFKEDVSNIINYGKYSAQVVTDAPTWTARNGEFLFYTSGGGSVNRVYFYTGNQWNFLQYTSGGTYVDEKANSWLNADTTAFPPTINDSFNVASLSELGFEGENLVTWSTGFLSTAYAVVGAGQNANPSRILVWSISSITATTTIFITREDQSSGPEGAKPVCVIAVGPQ